MRHIGKHYRYVEDTELNWLQYKMKWNIIVELIKIKKKEYYENVIDRNKENPIIIWKILKEIIRSEPSGNREKEDINFESWDNITDNNIANKFNLFYIQSIDNIIKYINSMSGAYMGMPSVLKAGKW